MSDFSTPKPLRKSTTLIIPDEQYAQMYSYIDACDKEIGGLATIKQVDDTVFQVDQIFVPKQLVNNAYLRMEDNDLVNINTQLSSPIVSAEMQKLVALSKKTKISIADIMAYQEFCTNIEKGQNKLSLQWHSHVDMMTTPSTTDYHQALRLSLDTAFYFMLILNKEQVNTAYLMMRSPIGIWQEIDIIFNKIEKIDSILKNRAISDITNKIKLESTHYINELGAIALRKEYVNDKQFMDRTATS